MEAQLGKPLDVSELKPCALCRRGMMHDGNIVFYEITLGQCVVDVGNVQRMHGLEMMMGGAVGLARAFYPSNTVAQRLPAERHLVCQSCLLESSGLSRLMEAENG
ncbi:MAG: hypothetical protein AB1698_03275 [Pseudomonadota bacterium]